jgi:RHS repeat-associated protein
MDDLPVGLLVGAGANQKLYYIEADALGTPRVVIDPDRNVAVWRWDLAGEAFGNNTPNEDPDGDGIAFVFDMRFPGQRYDSAAGMNYNYFRDYDPSIGRYSQSDPIGLSGGISAYGYVGGNPMTGVDPLGLETFGPWSFPPGPERDRLSRPDALTILNYYYNEMKRTRIKGPSDQVFHCIAACRAKKNSRNNIDEIRWLLDRKENVDFMSWKAGHYGQGLSREEMLEDNAQDRAVNETGLQCPANVPCAKQCRPYINALKPGSRALMERYLSSPANSIYPD